MCETIVFRHCTLPKQSRTRSLEVGKQTQWALVIQTYCLDRGSRQQHRKGKPRLSQAASLSWAEGAQSLEMPRCLELTGQRNQRKKLHKEKAPEIYRAYPQSLGNNHPKESEGTISWVHTVLETVCTSTRQSGKPGIWRGIRLLRILRREVP